uniref:Large ribosomal subunit protein uL29c n=1 Tax=Proboscia sp. TaxID=1923967 RepID=A0A2U9NM86_9STRA|nr:ribosomal protein L29 [Proboscia sp.]
MAMPQYKKIVSLSESDISKAIIETEKELFKLRFKKSTRQAFKPHNIVHNKRRLAQLKTLISSRFND